MALGETSVEKIILAEPRGFCAGVDRAVEAVRSALRSYGRPLYVRHQIVHNRFVLEALEREGAIFVESLDEGPPANASFSVRMASRPANGTEPRIARCALSTPPARSSPRSISK